jgi:chromosome segregation ATPase
MAKLDERLEAVIKRRDDLAAKKQRVEGRLEAARKALDEVEAECRSKGIDPANLDSTITTMDERYRMSIETLEQGVAAGEAALAPFLKET